jgi:hypothetical protein
MKVGLILEHLSTDISKGVKYLITINRPIWEQQKKIEMAFMIKLVKYI